MNVAKILLLLLSLGFLTSCNKQPDFIPIEVPDENRFRKVILSENITDPTDMAVFPNGNVIIVELDGDVKYYDKEAKITRRINHIKTATISESGLLAVVLDPSFKSNPWVYVIYSSLSENKNYLSRFTWRGDSLDLSTEKIILKIPDERACCHVGAGLDFDSQGNLYITVGDNTNPFGTNYAPLDERQDRKNFDAQRTSANSKDLRGKVLRITPQADGSYTIPKGNLFSDSTKGHLEIFAMGCRNPFKISVDKQTDIVYWGEVGPDASDADLKGPRGYDELNQAKKAGNFGWPFFIGENEAYADVDFVNDKIGEKFHADKPLNNSSNNTGIKSLPPAQKPFLYYPYDRSDIFPELGSGGRTIIAGPFYKFDKSNASAIGFPEYFNHTLFIADWMRNWIKVVHLTNNNTLQKIEDFMPTTNFRKPISIKFGTDGALYILEFGSLWGGNTDSRLSRVEYIKGNRPPIANLTVDKFAGPIPLTVTFSAENSIDYDQDKLQFQWNIHQNKLNNQDAKMIHTFTQPGIYVVKLILKDETGAQDTTSVKVIAGNTIPKVSIQLKGTSMFYSDSIQYEVVVNDHEDGSTKESLIDAEEVDVSLVYYPEGKVSINAAGHVSSVLDKGNTWIQESDCKACHARDAKSVGPSFIAIANKYDSRRNDPALINQLATKVVKGGFGVWGEVNMSAHPQLSKEVTTEMVRYILSLSQKETVPQKLPLKGTIVTNLNGKENYGSYVIKASYADKGASGLSSLTGTASQIIQSPVIQARDFDKVYELRKSDILSSVNKDAYATVEGIDLGGINEILFTVTTETEDTRIEVHLDSPTGPLLGGIDVPLGSWNNWQVLTMPIQATEGVHDIYVVFKNRLYVLSLLNLKSIRFNQVKRQP